MSINQLFKDDEMRNNLVKFGRISDFRDSYKLNRKVINRNTGKFWDNKIIKNSNFIDYMAKDRINKAVNLIPSHTLSILDIGIGDGKLIKLINKNIKKIKVFGIDIAPKQLQALSGLIRGTLKVGSILSIPFKMKFDCVFALEVLEHIPANKVFFAYDEIRRVLKDDGVAIISIPVNEKYSIYNNPNAHLRRYYPKLFYKELELAGMQVVNKFQLYAFKNSYKVKSFIAKHILTKRWNPNVILVSVVKK